MKKYLLLSFILILSSCATLGYDDHSKPVPKQDGVLTSIFLYEDILGTEIIIPLTEIVKPVNNETGWDNDDVVLVFKSPYIKTDFISSISWGSNSKWTKIRLKTKPPFGYGGAFAARVLDGEVRLYCGSKGQFLVNLNTIYLTIP